MTTPRRRFLHLCSAAGIGAFAGCTDSSAGNGAATPTERSESETPTRTTGTAEPIKPTSATGGWEQRAMFTADEVGSAKGLGTSVAVSDDGTTALVGAPLTSEPPAGETTATPTPTPTGTPGVNLEWRNAGAAYVFEADGDGSWRRRARLTADDADAGDRFGVAVALSDDGITALVGAERFDDREGVEAGTAYVFDSAGDSWTQTAELTVDDPEVGDNFGRAVALSGDGTTAVVGAHQDVEATGERPGVAYVFESDGDSWSRRAELAAEDGDYGDRFGRSVAVSDDGATVLVGAGLDEDPNGELGGSAYVFESSGGSWTQRAKLAADDGDDGDFFGLSVTLSGDGTTALVGAQSDEDPNGEQAGSAYVFEASGGSWTQRAKLAADDGTRGDLFGSTVALSSDGGTALVGAEKADWMSGAAYVFEPSGDSWSQVATVVPDDRSRSVRFAGSLALSGDGATTVVGDSSYTIDGAA